MPRHTVKNQPRREKSLPFGVVDFNEDDGVVSGIAALSGNIDRDNEMFPQGAFDKTVADRAGNFARVPMGVDHTYGLGVTTHMEVVGRSDLPRKAREQAPDATGGLYVSGQAVMMGDQLEVFRQIKARVKAGNPPGMSIMFWPVGEQYKEKAGNREYTVIPEAAVDEWTIALRKGARNTAAFVLGAKAGEPSLREKSGAYLAGSDEEKRQRITEAIKAAGLFEAEYVWVEATLSDHVIVSVSGDSTVTTYYMVFYAEIGGSIALGEVSPVNLQLSVAQKAARATDTVNEAAAGMKAGRVLRKRLLDRLEAALKELQEIRTAAIGSDDDEGTEDETPPPPPAAKAAAQPASDTQTDDDNVLDFELEMIRLQAARTAAGG